MRRDRQIELADLIRRHRERLDETAAELARRGEPISELEAELIVDAGNARLFEVESALRNDALRWETIRRAGARARSWTKPRLGRLQHYEPRPMRLPRRYFNETPPTPAPTISIVTPSFEQGRFLDRTIYSVVSQRYPSLEYHVQDGGSSDETLAVLARFESVLSSWASEVDAGQGDAINRGFEHVTGEIMAWLNSDDLLLPGSLAYVGRYFAANPDVDVVYGHRLMIDENDGQIGAWILPRHDDHALTLADYIPQETLFWRRRVWDAAGAHVDPSFGYALDWDLLLRFRDVGARMVRLPRLIGAFRVHPQQKTTAEDMVGLVETTRLRERVHGRYVAIDDVLNELRPYFLRHILLHSWLRFLDRIPLPREQVVTRPGDAWVATPLPRRTGLPTEAHPGAD